MTFEKINLSPQMIAALYKQALVPEEQTPGVPTKKTIPATPPTEAAVQPGSPATYKFLGKNQQHVLVIVRSPGEPFLPEEELQFLTKMLGACKLNLGDVAIVNDAAAKVIMQQVQVQLQPTKALLFGVEPSETGLPLSFPPFKEQEYAGCTYLFTPSLQALNQPTEEGKAMKAKLWACLKAMFNV